MDAFHHRVPSLAGRSRLSLTRAELEAWGEAFGRAASAPLLVALAGDLGAGKTTLVRAISRGYGVREDITSPTYALVHIYEGGPTPVYHLDLYRLTSEIELTNVGWDDIVAEHAIVLVEWPERAGSRMPDNHVPIDLEHDPADPDRRILLAG
jgi:tRNA threonylcarbamoyl adenosine modification protein YjeE